MASGQILFALVPVSLPAAIQMFLPFLRQVKMLKRKKENPFSLLFQLNDVERSLLRQRAPPGTAVSRQTSPGATAEKACVGSASPRTSFGY